MQGIYRVSGVKSKVESLCQRFDINPELVDLEEVHPNIISNVLKLYLRQVSSMSFSCALHLLKLLYVYNLIFFLCFPQDLY